ncbi:MAG: hypothetical protein ACRDJN_05570 [Chloroflexota bacterium]
MEAIPLGFALFLFELAAGGLLVTVALDWDGEVSPGFLFLNGAFLVAFAVAAVWLRSVLPAERLVDYPVAETWLRAEPFALAVFVALSAVYVVLLKLERRTAGRVVGSLAAASGVVSLAVSAAAYQPPAVPALLVLASLLAGALALGTVWSGMMLGHWYLVTPRLAPRPLLRLTAALATVLLAQLLLAGGQALAGVAAAALAASLSWLFWLRVGVGVAFPLVLSFLVWRTARVRSMMSATGLLYIALGAVLAGEIIARSLFFLSGAPV